MTQATSKPTSASRPQTKPPTAQKVLEQYKGTSWEPVIRERLESRLPKNISFKKIDHERADSPEKGKKKKSSWEDSPRIQAVRLHKEECRKAAAQYRGDNEINEKTTDYSQVTGGEFHADIKKAKIF